MTNNTQLVSVPRDLLERLLAVYSSSPWPAWPELARALEAAPTEDVRAGNAASRIRAAVIADAGQEGVSITEGRFGKALAALCVSIDAEDVRAVAEGPVGYAPARIVEEMQKKTPGFMCVFRTPSESADVPVYLCPQRPVEELNK